MMLRGTLINPNYWVVLCRWTPWRSKPSRVDHCSCSSLQERHPYSAQELTNCPSSSVWAPNMNTGNLKAPKVKNNYFPFPFKHETTHLTTGDSWRSLILKYQSPPSCKIALNGIFWPVSSVWGKRACVNLVCVHWIARCIHEFASLNYQFEFISQENTHCMIKCHCLDSKLHSENQ